MESKLVTSNICLDTSFIEGQNFLAGQKILELFRLSEENFISLYITDITYREVLQRFRKGLVETEEKTKKPRKELSTHGRILRNFHGCSYYHNLPDIIVEDLFQQFKAGFEAKIKDVGVTIIPTSHLTIGDIFDDYFENRLPFKDGKKKHEFPDAFTVKAIKDYIKEEKTYLLTSDYDILRLKDDTIIPISDSAELIDLVIRSYKEKDRITAIELISEQFNYQKAKIAKQIRENVELGIRDEFGSESNVGHLRLDSMDYLDLSDIEIRGFSIVHLNENSAKIECDIAFSFALGFTAIDASQEWFDVSNNIFFPASPQDYYIDENYELNATVDVKFNLEGETVTFDLNNVNDDRNFEIFNGTIRSMRAD